MTLASIVTALDALVLQIANNQPLDVPPPTTGLTEAEWAYVKGLASGEIKNLCDRLRKTLGAR